MTEHKFRFNCIWTIDETGCSTVPKSRQTLAKKGEKRVGTRAAVFNFKKRPSFEQKKAKKGQILLKYIPLENSPDLLQFKNTLDKKSNKISR